jgi:ubiquinone/menaquinone biosynthesis C-methylase UbiE
MFRPVAQVRPALQSGSLAGHPVFAAIYDRLLASAEKGGLRQMRSDLLREARGRTLELGTGTGHNLDHYPASVTELVLTEPDRYMATRLRRHVADAPPALDAVEVVDAPAEQLPFDDGSFDTVVSTLVFCTVRDPERAALEVRRVLRPDGALLFLEHVRSPHGAGLARWQDRVERPWGWFAGGCHPNRPTHETLPEAGLEVERLSWHTFPKSGMTPWVRPLISGSASPG